MWSDVSIKDSSESQQDTNRSRISEIYKSGKFSMSTWIPFVWAVIQIIYAIVTSYSMTSVIL